MGSSKNIYTAIQSMILISSISSEQEIKASERIKEAQAEGTFTLLSKEKTTIQLIAVAEDAAGFAEAAAQKHLSQESPPVACKSGCSWCCYQFVRVSVPEIARISAYIRDLPSTDLIVIADRLRTLDKATRGLTLQQRVGIPKPCAYLQDNKCIIHSVRPLACAEFTSYDVQVCKRGKRIGFKTNSVMHEKARMLAYYAVQQGLAQGLKDAIPKADHKDLELTAASVIALNNPKVFSSWIEGSSIFNDAHINHGKRSL